MAEIGHCGDCKHWENKHLALHGVCKLITWDETGDPPQDGLAKVEEHYPDPRWSTGASLVTHKRFGCTEFSAHD